MQEPATDLNRLDKRIFPDNSGPHNAEIFEIKGRRGHGKTHLLTYLVAKTIIPVSFGGKNCGVLLINADNDFDMDLLRRVMIKLHRLSFAEEEDNWIKKSLKNLLILNITQFNDLNDVFLTIYKVLRNNKNIRNLSIDSINSFYSHFANDPFYFHKNHYYLQNQMKELKSMCQLYNLVLFYTKTTDYNPYMYLNFNNQIDYMWELIKFRCRLYARVTMLSDPKSVQYKLIIINEYGLEWTRMNNCDENMSKLLNKFYLTLLVRKRRMIEKWKNQPK